MSLIACTQVFDEPLTDTRLAQLLSAGRQIHSLSLSGLDLQSDTHANTPWPWTSVSVHTLRVAMLARLPHPGTEGPPRTVRCSQIQIDDSVEQVRTLFIVTVHV